MRRYLIIMLLSVTPSLLFANGSSTSFHVLKSLDLKKILDNNKEKPKGPRAFESQLTDASLFSGTPGDMTLHTKEYSYRIAVQITNEGQVWFDIHRSSADKKEQIDCQGSGEFPRYQGTWIKPGWEKEEYVVVIHRIVLTH